MSNFFDTNGGEDAVLAATYVSQSQPLETVASWCFGDSYSNNSGGNVGPVAAAFPYRVVSRNRMLALSQFGVGGTRSDQILSAVQTSWVPGSRGVVFLSDVLLNDCGGNSGGTGFTSTAGTPTSTECFRSILTYLTAQTVRGNGAPFAYGPNWSNGTSTTTGSYVDFSWTGDTCYLLTQFTTGAGGTVTIKDASNTTIATVTTGGFPAPVAGTLTWTGSVKLAGFGAGNHTLRATFSSGTTATMTGIAIPLGANAPEIVWYQPGLTLDSGRNALMPTYITALQAILSDFPTVVQVATDGNWNASTMTAPDGLHLNDLGNSYAAGRVQAALAGVAYRTGQNILTAAVPSYTDPTPAYTVTGATAPSAPTSVAGTTGYQVNLTWNRAADGGSTMTGQSVQASSDGGTTWTTVVANAGAFASSTSVASGLTNGTSYVFRVGATNSVGTTYSAASAAVTAGPVPYASDTFNRANSSSLGSTEVGSIAWASMNVGAGGSTSIASHALKIQPNSASPTGVAAYIDESHTDGSLSITVPSLIANGGGLFFRGSSATTGYVVYYDGTQYQLKKATLNINQFVALATASGVTPAAGDTLKVVLAGTSIKLYVNGTLAITATDSTYTGTYKGVWGFAGATSGETFTNFIWSA